MIDNERFPKDFPIGLISPGLSEVFAAAIVNPTFCRLLLTDPETALKQGYKGGQFTLSAEETELFLSIGTDSLQDLAKMILTSKPK